MSDKTNDTFGERVRIKRVELRNYCAVKCAVFNVIPGINSLAGVPAQGKSTIPQAIAELFTKGGVSSVPLRRGAGDGLIRVELDDDSIIEKKIGPKGAQPVRRTDAEGKKTGIDTLEGWISQDVFKPLAFAALADTKPGRRAQAEVIAALAGLDTEKIDAKRAKELADESAAKKAAEELEAQARGIDVPAMVEAPGEEREHVDPVDVAAIAGRKAEVAQAIAANDKIREQAKQAAKEAEKAQGQLEKCRALVDELRAKLETAETALREAREDSRQADLDANNAEERAAQLVDPVTDAIDAMITEAQARNTAARAETEAHNKAVRAALAQRAEAARLAGERAKLEEKAKAKRDEERAAGGRKRDCDAEKAAAIAGAAQRMPVPGLTIEGEGSDREVFLNGVPLSQASTMQRMQLGCALALARQPKLGFLWIDYGNELDEKALEWLQGFLEENNADAFVVHVIEADEVDTADGLIVEGGEIKADRRKTRKPRAKAAPSFDDLENSEAPITGGPVPATDDEPPAF